MGSGHEHNYTTECSAVFTCKILKQIERYIKQFSLIKERNSNLLPFSKMVWSKWFVKHINILNLPFQGNILSNRSSREQYEHIFRNKVCSLA